MVLPLLVWVTIGSSGAALGPPPTEPPLIHSRPFVAIWNAPTDRCRQLRVPLDTGAFDAVTTPAAVPGQFLSLFYQDRLGIYPRVDTSSHRRYKGAIPQNSNLTEHLAKARGQIHQYIPKDSQGLAVIDWESWRPLWDQNWGSKRVYQELSLAYAREKAPFCSPQLVSKLAKNQFQHASRGLMQETLRLGTGERPNRRWGFYLFPDCFNYGWDKPGFTGKCPAEAQKQNDQLLWLREHSTALFPSIYLNVALKNSPRARLYVRNRVQEALRVASLPKRPHTAPVYVFSRPLYRGQNQDFLSQVDLVSTVGESAALGAAGVVMWGASKDYNSKEACESMSDYLASTFSPYIANATAAAALCSELLCRGRGRCVRKNYDSAHYMHLDPAHFTVLRAGDRHVATGRPSEADLNDWAAKFTCQCYAMQHCSANPERSGLNIIGE